MKKVTKKTAVQIDEPTKTHNNTCAYYVGRHRRPKDHEAKIIDAQLDVGDDKSLSPYLEIEVATDPPYFVAAYFDLNQWDQRLRYHSFLESIDKSYGQAFRESNWKMESLIGMKCLVEFVKPDRQHHGYISHFRPLTSSPSKMSA